MAYFVEDLVTAIKSRSFAPTSHSTFSDPDGFIMLADDELRIKLVSDLMSVREDFFLTSVTVPVTANLGRYTMPRRAVGNSLKAVFFEATDGSRRMLDRVDLERSEMYGTDTGEVHKFYFEGDEIVLLPAPAQSLGSIVVSYFSKPNQLTKTSSCAKITAITSLAGTTTFTLDTDLTSTLSAGSKVDILSAVSPYLLWAQDVDLTAITSNSAQVTTTSIQNNIGTVEPQVGDYLCPRGFANIPMIPEEFHPVLAQMAVCRALRSMGMLERYNAEKAELEEMRAAALRLVRNRAEIAPLLFNNRSGLLSAFR